jgi:hypothetical protein
MNKINKKYLIFSLFIFFLIDVILIGSFVFERYKKDLRRQFFCADIYTGMQKDEVKNVFAEYGSYSWNDDYVLPELTHVYFDEFLTRDVLGHPIILTFDNNNKLIAISSREKLGDEIQIDCTR